MSLKSTPSRYGSVAMAFHWLTALAILALMVTGQMMDGLQDAARQIAILKWHVPMGLAVLLLTLARIAWWFFLPTATLPHWALAGRHLLPRQATQPFTRCYW